MFVKKGDKVMIIAGKDKGKSGEITRAFPGKDRVIVAGVNKLKKHQRPTKKGTKGQMVEKEMPLHVSNVKLVKS